MIRWDFTNCDAETVNAWKSSQLQITCRPGKGLLLEPQGGDPYLRSPQVWTAKGAGNGARWARLRVSVRYPNVGRGDGTEPPLLSQWYWRVKGAEWREENSRTLPAAADGQ